MKTPILICGILFLGALIHQAFGVTYQHIEVRKASGLPYIDFSRDATTDFHFRLAAYATDSFAIMGSGNVGIGVAFPSYKLDVNGTLRAKEIIVETGWADYVFGEDYVLTPLEEVESFISAHGHLPGIPSGKEVEENGLRLAEMQTLMMAKIEELTLHLIELNKKVEALERENRDLHTQLAMSHE